MRSPLTSQRTIVVAALLGLLVAEGSAHASTPVVAFAPFRAIGIDSKNVKRIRRWLRAATASLPATIRLRHSRKLARKLARIPACVDASCVAGVAKKLGIARIVMGHVGSISGAFVVYLQLLDDKGKVLRRVNSLLDPAKHLRRDARVLLFRLLAPKRYTGSLAINVDVAGAWIYLDGHRVGRGPKLQLPKVSVGKHAIRITQPAYRDFVRFVRVAFQTKTHVKASLGKLAIQSTRMHLAGAKPLTDAELPWYRRWWVVSTFGAVILAAATTTILLIPKTVERDRQATVRP